MTVLTPHHRSSHALAVASVVLISVAGLGVGALCVPAAALDSPVPTLGAEDRDPTRAPRSGADGVGVAGVLEDGPPVLRAREPRLPAAAGWPFPETFSRTSGSGRLDGGALLWTDFLYDDTGTGSATYADNERTHANGTDIFRAGVGLGTRRTYWRVDWNTLADPSVPIVAWGLDTDDDPRTGASKWPAGANVASTGLDRVLLVSARGAWLVDPAHRRRVDLTRLGARLTVDRKARSFVLSVPRRVLPVRGTWRTSLVAGVADERGRTFAPPPGAAAADPRVYNVSFRTDAQEASSATDWSEESKMGTVWNNAGQSAALVAGDISAYGTDIRWRDLTRRRTTPEPMPTGYSTRWYVSSADLGQGLNPAARGTLGPELRGPQFYGRVQPYTVYVPRHLRRRAPLTLLLHAGDRNHNGFLGSTQHDVYGPMCERRRSICVTPLGRGNSTWYLGEAERDVFEVWHQVAAAYRIDPDRTVVGGWSMGGVGATRFVSDYPHLFAGAVIVSGAGSYDSQGRRDQPHDPLRTENWHNLVTFFDSGSEDVALANTRLWDEAAHAAGVRYRVHYYDGADHGTLGTSLGWSDAARYLRAHDPERTRAPAQIRFRWEPDDQRPDLGAPVDRAYWLSRLQARDATATWSRVGARSQALPGARVGPALHRMVKIIDGRRVEVSDQRWRAGAAPRLRQRLLLRLTNVAEVTVDLRRAGLRSPSGRITISTDGPTTIRLVGAPGAAANLVRTVDLGAGTHRLRVR